MRSDVAQVPTDRANERFTQLLCAWSGVAATVSSALSIIVVGGYVPARDPSASGPRIARWYSENTDAIRVGLALTLVGFTLLLPFGIVVALQTRRAEHRPVMAAVQIGSVAIGVLEGVMTTVIWAVTSFRPDDVDPDITRMLNDLGWFTFLFKRADVLPLAHRRGHRHPPRQPGRAGLSPLDGLSHLWTALLFLPGILIVFFKDGPFGFDGVFALYIPAGVYRLHSAEVGGGRRRRTERRGRRTLRAESVPGGHGDSSLLFALTADDRFGIAEPDRTGILTQEVRRLAGLIATEARDRGIEHVDLEMAVTCTTALVLAMGLLEQPALREG